YRVGSDLDSVEGHPRADAGIGEADALDVEAVRALLDREQGDAFVAAGGDEDDVGGGALDDELLLAGEAEAIAAALRARLDDFGAVLGAFVDGQRGDGLAGEDSGQPALAEFGAAGRLDDGNRRHQGAGWVRLRGVRECAW